MRRLGNLKERKDVRTKGATRPDHRTVDHRDSPLHAKLLEPLHDMTMHEITSKTSHPRSVVDLGCGSGQFLRRAATVFPEAELVGVDGSAGMIHAAEMGACPGERIRFLRGRAEALPLADASFDLAVTTASFHHWADQPCGLSEVSRVLRAGGTLVLADVVAAGALRVGALAWLLGRLDGGRFSKPDALDRMLASAGFQVERRTPAPQWGGALQVTVARRV